MKGGEGKDRVEDEGVPFRRDPASFEIDQIGKGTGLHAVDIHGKEAEPHLHREDGDHRDHTPAANRIMASCWGGGPVEHMAADIAKQGRWAANEVGETGRAAPRETPDQAEEQQCENAVTG